MNDAERTEAVAEVMEEPMFVVRLWDMMDGWIDVSGPLTGAGARELWLGKTCGGTRNTRYEDGDYYAVYPSKTVMLMVPEYFGR